MMTFTPQTLPLVDPMMVREFIAHDIDVDGGYFLVFGAFECKEIGLAKERFNDIDEDVVDCSNGIFRITSMAIAGNHAGDMLVFPSRRFRFPRPKSHDRAHGEGQFEYIGNPILLSSRPEGLLVRRLPEFLIKSGMELGY